MKKLLGIAIAFGIVGAIFNACGGDDSGNPAPMVTVDASTGSGGNAGAAGSSSTGASGDMAGSAGTMGAGGAVSEGGMPEAAVCTMDGGDCFACTPATLEQYLNACTGTGVDCLKFTTALPALAADGGLPPLPM